MGFRKIKIGAKLEKFGGKSCIGAEQHRVLSADYAHVQMWNRHGRRAVRGLTVYLLRDGAERRPSASQRSQTPLTGKPPYPRISGMPDFCAKGECASSSADELQTGQSW